MKVTKSTKLFATGLLLFSLVVLIFKSTIETSDVSVKYTIDSNLVQQSGGWFLEPDGTRYHQRVMAKNHVPPDDFICTFLCQRLKGSSMYDLGAGIGQYGICLDYMNCDVNWIGYDGAFNVEDFTNGFVKKLDLSKPISFNKRSFTMSLEVGEHIPKDYEQVFLDNISKSTSKDLMISWAVVGQSGHYHVNCQNNDYIISELEKRGFMYQHELSNHIRKNVKISWFKYTIMYFSKRVTNWVLQLFIFKENEQTKDPIIVGADPRIGLSVFICGKYNHVIQSTLQCEDGWGNLDKKSITLFNKVSADLPQSNNLFYGKLDSDVTVNLTMIKNIMDNTDTRVGLIGKIAFGKIWDIGFKFMSGPLYWSNFIPTITDFERSGEDVVMWKTTIDQYSIIDLTPYYVGFGYTNVYNNNCKWLIKHKEATHNDYSSCIHESTLMPI